MCHCVQSLGNCAIVQPVHSLLYLLTSVFTVLNIVNLLLTVVAYCNAITCPSPVTGVWLDNTLQSLASNVDPPSVTSLCLMLCVLYLLYSYASCAGPSQLPVPLTMEQTWSSQGDVWTLLWFLLLWYTRWGVYSTLVSVILYILRICTLGGTVSTSIFVRYIQYIFINFHGLSVWCS